MSEVQDVRCCECGKRWDGAVTAGKTVWTCARCRKAAAGRAHKEPLVGTEPPDVPLERIHQCSGCQHYSNEPGYVPRSSSLLWLHNTETDKWYCYGCAAMGDVAWRMQMSAKEERTMNETNRVLVSRSGPSRVAATVKLSVVLDGLNSIDIVVPERMSSKEWDDLVAWVESLRNPDAA